MAELILEVITPGKPIFNDEIKSITMPGTDGSFQVLVNHAPIISTIEIGIIKIVLKDNSVKFYTTGGGTIEVLNNKILLLADSFEPVEAIDIERAKKALERAKERLSHKEDKTIDLERATAALRRAMNRLEAVEKKIKSEV